MARGTIAPGALGRRRRGAALIDQYAHPLSADEYSGNRRAISTLKRYSDPGDYHSPIVGAFEMFGTGAIPQVADLLRLMKERHSKSGVIMVERIAEKLRAAGASGRTSVGPAGREIDRENLIAGLTDHFNGTRPEPEQEVGRDRLTTATGRTSPTPAHAGPLAGGGSAGSLVGGGGTDRIVPGSSPVRPALGLGGPPQAPGDPKTTPPPKKAEAIDPFGNKLRTGPGEIVPPDSSLIPIPPQELVDSLKEGAKSPVVESEEELDLYDLLPEWQKKMCREKWYPELLARRKRALDIEDRLRNGIRDDHRRIDQQLDFLRPKFFAALATSLEGGPAGAVAAIEASDLDRRIGVLREEGKALRKELDQVRNASISAWSAYKGWQTFFEGKCPSNPRKK